MKVEVLVHPDDSSRTVYRYVEGDRAIELWQVDERYLIWRSPHTDGPLSTSGRPGEKRVDVGGEARVPLCTAQLMALKLLGVEPERSVPHSGSGNGCSEAEAVSDGEIGL